MAFDSLSCQNSSNSSTATPSPDEFCEYFSSVFQREEFEAGTVTVTNVPFREHFSCYEVQRSLSLLKRKSCGPDNLPYLVFRNSSFSLAPAITFLFNRSIRESQFPACLKRAYVCPIPKISRPIVVSDFRPISLLPILSKFLERLVCKHFLLPFIRDKLATPQFAYVPGPGSGAC